jgi:hypothetical protein
VERRVVRAESTSDAVEYVDAMVDYSKSLVGKFHRSVRIVCLYVAAGVLVAQWKVEVERPRFHRFNRLGL